MMVALREAEIFCEWQSVFPSRGWKFTWRSTILLWQQLSGKKMQKRQQKLPRTLTCSSFPVSVCCLNSSASRKLASASVINFSSNSVICSLKVPKLWNWLFYCTFCNGPVDLGITRMTRLRFNSAADSNLHPQKRWMEYYYSRVLYYLCDTTPPHSHWEWQKASLFFWLPKMLWSVSLKNHSLWNHLSLVSWTDLSVSSAWAAECLLLRSWSCARSSVTSWLDVYRAWLSCSVRESRSSSYCRVFSWKVRLILPEFHWPMDCDWRQTSRLRESEVLVLSNKAPLNFSREETQAMTFMEWDVLLLFQ